MPLGPKMALLGGHMFYIGLYREKHEQIFLSENTALEIWYEASPSEHLPCLVK